MAIVVNKTERRAQLRASCVRCVQSIKAVSVKIEPITFVYYVPKNINNLPFKYELKSLKTSDTVISKKYEVRILRLDYSGYVYIEIGLVDASSLIVFNCSHCSHYFYCSYCFIHYKQKYLIACCIRIPVSASSPW